MLQNRTSEPVPGLAAAVLVGGASSRMGQDKASLDVAGRTALARVLDVASALTATLAIVGRGEPRELDVDLAVLADAPGRPRCALAGLEAALRWTPEPRLLVLACDLPAVPAPLLRALATESPPDIDVAYVDGPRGPEPLCAIYASRCLAAVEAAFDADRLSLRGFTEGLATWTLPPERQRLLDPEGRASWNMNTPEDRARIARALAHT